MGVSGLAAMGVLSGCASGQPAASKAADEPAKVAVVCFSATGNTWDVAQKVADAADAELIRIEAAEPYTSADLNYNKDCRANTEQNEGTARPKIAGGAPDLSGYATVYLGYPIWWGRTPRIMLTLLEAQDLSGKTVIPFCTSGGSDIEGSLDELEAAAKDATWQEGMRFEAGASAADVEEWVKDAGKASE